MLQRRGVAKVTALTEPFGNQVTRMAAYQPSDRPLPYIVIDHPLQMISPEVMVARAEQLTKAIIALLDDKMPENAI